MTQQSRLTKYFYRINYSQRLKYICRTFNSNKPFISIDIGAGYGHMSSLINKLKYSKVYAIEPRLECQKELKKLGLEKVFSNNLSEIIELVPKNIELITCISVIDQVKNKDIFLKDLKKIMTSDTLVYLEVRNINYIGKLFGILKSMKSDISRNEYIKLFKYNNIKIIDTNGFCRPINISKPHLFIKSLISNLLFFVPYKFAHMNCFLLKLNQN